jgi:hypothetical protein
MPWRPTCSKCNTKFGFFGFDRSTPPGGWICGVHCSPTWKCNREKLRKPLCSAEPSAASSDGEVGWAAGTSMLPRWIGVAPLGADAGGLPAHVKPTMKEALAAFLRFRAADPTGRGPEIRLPDNGAYATGWAVEDNWNDPVPGVIGGGDFRGLQLDGEDRWNGLRIVTPEVDVVYGEGGRYSVVIKEGLTSIGVALAGPKSTPNPQNLGREVGAFQGCTGLTSVIFPEELTSIGDGAFYECSGLTSVTFPEGLTSIGSSAFCGCSGLTSVTFPEGLTSIRYRAFGECSGLTSVTFPAGFTTSGEGAFGGCTGLTSLTFPEGLTTIGDGAFQGCTGLTSLTFPAGPTGLTTIGALAFYGCTGLTSLTFPAGLTTIESHAFKGCTGLTSLTFPPCLTTIRRWTFQLCTGLTSVTFAEGLTTIEEGAFSLCTGLTSVTFPEGLTNIGIGAFYGCASLTFPEGLTTIGECAFYECDTGQAFNNDWSVLISEFHAEYSTPNLDELERPISVPNKARVVGCRTGGAGAGL